MTAIISASDATIQTAKLEEMTVALIRFGQLQERSTAQNPFSINNITSSINEDAATLTATLNFPCIITLASDGKLSVAANDYLTNVTFTNGTGEVTIKSTNWVQSLIECTIMQKNLELTAAKNPTAANYITWSVNNGDTDGINNAVFAVQYSLPVTFTQSVNGDSVTKGFEYLL